VAGFIYFKGNTMQGDFIEILQQQPDNSINLVYSDPPYQLGTQYTIDKNGEYAVKGASIDFMSKWQGITPEQWKQFFILAMDKVKHGGYIAMFGMEENGAILQYYAIRAGFEICQSMAWYNVQGFPKAHDIEKGMLTKIETALKDQHGIEDIEWQ
jgi:site-specific DNA-methyltransferase (adenine-specific)